MYHLFVSYVSITDVFTTSKLMIFKLTDKGNWLIKIWDKHSNE